MRCFAASVVHGEERGRIGFKMRVDGCKQVPRVAATPDEVLFLKSRQVVGALYTLGSLVEAALHFTVERSVVNESRL